MKRIKYKSTGQAKEYVSVKAIPSSYGDLIVYYDMKTLTYIINKAGTDTPVTMAAAVSNHQLKKAIKKALKELGVSFDKEARAKRK